MLPLAIAEQAHFLQAVQVEAVSQARRLMRQFADGRMSRTEATQHVVKLYEPLQWSAAYRGSIYGAVVLAAQDQYEEPDFYPDLDAAVGWTRSGRSTGEIFSRPFAQYQTLRLDGASYYEARTKAERALELVMASTLADTFRLTGGLDITSREQTVYVRHINPPSCSRCIQLAGRIYRFNQGFQRHPGCDCVHVPTKTIRFEDAVEDGLTTNPYEYFDSLSEGEQDRVFGIAKARAIRDGADIHQVVNSYRGRFRGITTEGMGKHGYAGMRVRAAGYRHRLTPETIYKMAGDSRKKAQQLLEMNGYILPGGQNPAGVLRGQVEGWGNRSRGVKTAQATKDAIEFARITGKRLEPDWLFERDGWQFDKARTATATAAELRLMEAERNRAFVKVGINPFSERATVLRGAPVIDPSFFYDKPLNAAVRARVEIDYRTALAGMTRPIPKIAVGKITLQTAGRRGTATGVASVLALDTIIATPAKVRSRVIVENSAKKSAGNALDGSGFRNKNTSKKPVVGAGGSQKPPINNKHVSAGNEDEPFWYGDTDYGNKPDEYIPPIVGFEMAFTRSTRPRASYNDALHVFERHASTAPVHEDEQTFFPERFDNIEAYKFLMDRITYLGEPKYESKALTFEETFDGVTMKVIMRKIAGTWRVKTMWPVSGAGVKIARNGRKVDLQ